MRVAFLTIWPVLVRVVVRVGLLGRAIERGVLRVDAINLRDFGVDRHGTVDDTPYGGGHGMIFRPEPFFEAVDFLRNRGYEGAHILLMSARGRPVRQSDVRRWAEREAIIFLCPRYEGVDERVVEGLADEEVTVGDFVCMGGELPALMILEAIVRLRPEMGKREMHAFESLESGLLEYPQYTRPPEYRGMRVPEVLLSGNHEQIRRWRLREALRVTMERRPELLERPLSEEEKEILEELRREAYEHGESG